MSPISLSPTFRLCPGERCSDVDLPHRHDCTADITDVNAFFCKALPGMVLSFSIALFNLNGAILGKNFV